MSVMFEAETAVQSVGGARYRVAFSADWWVVAGANGGVVAATILRACSAEVAAGRFPRDAPDARVPRSLTVHYLSPPQVGEAEVLVTIERAGRGVTFCSARLSQRGRLLAVAVAAYAGARVAVADFGHKPMPELPPPGACPPLQEELAPTTIRGRWDCRIGLGSEPARPSSQPLPAPGSVARAQSGGWIRLADPCPVDHHVIAAMADGWIPPIFTLAEAPSVIVPTLELTVHFRDSHALQSVAEDAWFVCTFTSELAQEGFMEEDGMIWSADGRLIAMSRQLAVLNPREAT